MLTAVDFLGHFFSADRAPGFHIPVPVGGGINGFRHFPCVPRCGFGFRVAVGASGAGVGYAAVFGAGGGDIGGDFVCMGLARADFVDFVPAVCTSLQEPSVVTVGCGCIFNYLIIVPRRREDFPVGMDIAGVALVVEVEGNLADVVDVAVGGTGRRRRCGLTPEMPVGIG